MITRSIEIDITLTPSELAEAFANMGSRGQAAFFSRLLDHMSARDLVIQMHYVRTEEGLLTYNGRIAMTIIGEYGQADVQP